MKRSEAQIIQKIEELLDDLALNFRRICELLTGIEKHDLHKHWMFKWYRQVASNKLEPDVIMAMGGKRPFIKHMVGRPREVQMKVAQDGLFDWVRAVKGEVVDRRGSWRQMADDEFKRMFPIGGPVRTVQEQRAVLLAELAAGPVTHIRQQPVARVDMDAGTFRLGAQVVPLSVLCAALAEVGIPLPMPMDGAAPQDCGPRVGVAAK
ncbi:MAG: hypothetical protein ACK5PF_10610 [bacterium]